jgi:hypothetical protein
MLSMSNPQVPQLDISSERHGHGRRKDDIRNEQLARLLTRLPEAVF